MENYSSRGEHAFWRTRRGGSSATRRSMAREGQTFFGYWPKLGNQGSVFFLPRRVLWVWGAYEPSRPRSPWATAKSGVGAAGSCGWVAPCCSPVVEVPGPVGAPTASS